MPLGGEPPTGTARPSDVSSDAYVGRAWCAGTLSWPAPASA